MLPVPLLMIGATALAVALMAQPVLAADTPVCAGCHEQSHTSTMMHAHGAKNDASGSMCMACHGDASEHLKDPAKNKPPNLIKHGTFAEKTAICMTCHAGSRHLGFWEAGQHARNEVTCAKVERSDGAHPCSAPIDCPVEVRKVSRAASGGRLACHSNLKGCVDVPFEAGFHASLEARLRLPAARPRSRIDG